MRWENGEDIVDRLDAMFQARKERPPYRDLYRDLDIERIDDMDAWRRLPLISKERLLERTGEDLLVADASDMVGAGATAGTSGTMAVVPKRTADIAALQEQFRPRLADMFPPGSRTMLVQDPQWSYDAIRFLQEADRFAAMGDHQDLGFTARMMESVGADGIYTTTTTALRLGPVLTDRDVSIERVVLGGEGLSDAARRELEQHYPGATILQSYGSRELGYVGYQCAELAGSNTYHPVPDHHFHEIIDPETGEVLPDGETGELVTTTLWTDAGMAFTRYQTGDAATHHTTTCTCGAEKRLELEGKITFDSIKLRGITIYREDFEEAMAGVDGLAAGRYQLRITEERSDGEVRSGITVRVPPDGLSTDPERAAEDLMDRFQVTSDHTWADIVDRGVFLPLTVEPVDAVADGLKTRRVVDERTGDG